VRGTVIIINGGSERQLPSKGRRKGAERKGISERSASPPVLLSGCCEVLRRGGGVWSGAKRRRRRRVKQIGFTLAARGYLFLRLGGSLSAAGQSLPKVNARHRDDSRELGASAQKLSVGVVNASGQPR
jgi:hypothetical protein